MRSVNLLNKWGFGDSDMNSTVVVSEKFLFSQNNAGIDYSVLQDKTVLHKKDRYKFES